MPDDAPTGGDEFLTRDSAVPEDSIAGPWFRIIVLRDTGDTIIRGLGEEAASLLRARGASVVVTEEVDLVPPPDGLVVVASANVSEQPVLDAAPGLAERAVALVVAGEDRKDGQALAHNVRRALRQEKALVLPRQLVLEREALGIYGLEDEDAREKLDGLVELLVHEADRLHAKRTGWEEPHEAEGKEWVGPQVREREDAEADRERRGGL